MTDYKHVSMACCSGLLSVGASPPGNSLIEVVLCGLPPRRKSSPAGVPPEWQVQRCHCLENVPPTGLLPASPGTRESEDGG